MKDFGHKYNCMFISPENNYIYSSGKYDVVYPTCDARCGSSIIWEAKYFVPTVWDEQWDIVHCTSTLWWRRAVTHYLSTLWHVGSTWLRVHTVITHGTVNRTSSRSDECLIGGKEQRSGGGIPGKDGAKGVPLHGVADKKCLHNNKSRLLGMPFVFF